MIGAPASLVGGIFCGEPVSTPDRVRGKLFPENAPESVTPGKVGGKILLA
jgi:hypothetical protein